MERYGTRTDRALALWVKLARARSTLARRTEEHIRTTGLTGPQFGVLECLGHKGQLTFRELSEKMLVTSGNMTVVVDNLEENGLAARVRCDTDRRQVYVRLTEKGKGLFDEVFPVHAALVAELVSVLTPEEQTELSRLLKKLGTGVAAARKDRQLA